MSQPTTLLLVRADGSRAPTPTTSGSLSPADPFGTAREIAYLGPDGVAAGVVQVSGSFTVADYPQLEMVVVHSGHLTLQAEDCTLELGRGASAVIGRGTALQIRAQADTLWAFCAQVTDEQNPGLTPLDPLAHLSPSTPPDAQILISAGPQCRSKNSYKDNANVLIGVWDSTPYTRHGRPHKVNELMHLIEGSVTLHSPEGESLQLNAGDSVFVPLGAECAWESHVYVRKFYVCK
ncbi:cupin domain-containing protein [Pseudomonas sp.]|uniref:cupin domain-containing protein n=1 Tax=Pseudomonas sp. TaxID=306 RepID=UPI00299DAE5D|nr:cupin domain-containing protein [Pseudomonas sp.]MDX1370264.1 cupin domain-containing protein [Pseudomonas sp.]